MIKFIFIFALFLTLSQVHPATGTISTLTEDVLGIGVYDQNEKQLSAKVSEDKNMLIVTRSNGRLNRITRGMIGSSDTFKISNEQINELRDKQHRSGTQSFIDITSTKGKSARLYFAVNADGGEGYMLV